MPIVVKVAEGNSELESTMSFRYKAVLQNIEKFPNFFLESEKISDFFDVYPSTINVMAYEKGQTIANLRAVLFNESELSLKVVFDFQSSKENLRTDAYIVDLLVVDKKYANFYFLEKEMYKNLFLYLHKKGFKYIFLLLNETQMNGMSDIPFKVISKEKIHNDGRELYPLVVNIEEYYHQFVSMIKDKEILKFNDAFYKVIFFPGEIPVLEGEKGSSGFLVDVGEFQILIRQNGVAIKVGSAGPGNLVGEVAMVTGERRTATIIASQLTSSLAFDRSNFMDLMYKNPAKALDIFKIFSKRLFQANKRISEKK